MPGRAGSFIDGLDRRAGDIADACTACGACVSVCPTPAIAGFAAGVATEMAAGVRDILRGGAGTAPARAWAANCCGSGACLTVCEHGINPRFMLAMARRAMARGEAAAARRARGKTAFQVMSRGVRVLSRLQLPPELLARLAPGPAGASRDQAPPDLVFYTGCNLLKTPHIGLLCLDVLDRLGQRYAVHGGPASCCGILQMRPGDDGNAGRQGFATLDRLAASGAPEVLSWCPSCQIQFGEITLPTYEATHGPAFAMTLFPVWLARQLPRLRPLLTRPVRKRVALFEFPGAEGVVAGVTALLSAIPGLELVDLQQPVSGYMMTSLAHLPDHRRQRILGGLRAAEAASVTTLAGIFHADHRELAAHEPAWPFEVVNYMELIGASIGLRREDLFKRLKLMGEVDAVIAATVGQIAAHGLDLDEVRDVVLRDMLGEQHLPVDRALHENP